MSAMGFYCLLHSVICRSGFVEGFGSGGVGRLSVVRLLRDNCGVKFCVSLTVIGINPEYATDA